MICHAESVEGHGQRRSIVEAALASFLSLDGAAPTGDDTAAVRAEAEKRFSYFIEALARRMETGRHLYDEIVRSGDTGIE